MTTLRSLCIALAVLSFAGSPLFSASENSSPNVLFIVVDDLRPELGCYGSEAIQTPHIDRLASQGSLFENAYCQVPVCGASRASVCWRIERHGHSSGACKHHPAENDMRYPAPPFVALPQQPKGSATAALPPALAKAVARISRVVRACRTCCDVSCAV